MRFTSSLVLAFFIFAAPALAWPGPGTAVGAEKSARSAQNAPSAQDAAKAEKERKREELIRTECALFIEEWRSAWERADLESYAECYSPDARQGDVRGLTEIAGRKSRLWSRVKPMSIVLDGFSFSRRNGEVRVGMVQEFMDSKGYKDKGYKTLSLRFDGRRWRIVQEEWSPMQ